MSDAEDYYASSDGESYLDDEDEARNLDDLELVRGERDDPELDPADHKGQRRYVVLTEREIRQRLSDEAAATAEVLSVPVDWALALLVHHRWMPQRLHEDWFSDRQDRIRAAVGLCADEEIVTTTTTCAICAEGDKPAAEMASAGCAHRYCHDCWRRYVAAAREEGRCLALRCPDASCSRAVLRGTVQRFLAPTGGHDDDVYERLLARDYVQARGRWMKPCPAPGCGRVIDLTVPITSGDADVACACGAAFCWRCGGSPHWPSTCAAAARFWTSEADEASALWVALHTKPCPQCRRPIERYVGGCRYMQCAAPCFHRFCWRCLGSTAAPIFNHDLCFEATTTPIEEAEAEVWRARQALDTFLRYQDMWAANLRARRNAEREAARMRDDLTRLPRGSRGASEKGEVAEAWDVVAEGRRVLGNACAHGFGLRGADTRTRELFEYQHGEADAVLDHLQQEAKAAAANLDKFVGDFRARNQLVGLTRVTQGCIENFAKAVEEGMPPEMMSATPASTTNTSAAAENCVLTTGDLDWN